MRWCLLTAYDTRFASVAAHSVPAMKRYAALYDMTFREVVNYDCGRPPAWAKFYLTLEQFKAGFDFVFWVDADAVIRRFDDDIRSYVTPNADFYFVKETWMAGTSLSSYRMNTGVYVMRNCDVVRTALENAIARKEFINHPVWDQAALSAEFGLHSVLWERERHRPDEPTSAARRISWLPLKWNSSPKFEPTENAVVHHHYGLSIDGKLTAIQLDNLFDGLGHRTAEIASMLAEVFKAIGPVLNSDYRRNAALEKQARKLLRNPLRALTHRSAFRAALLK